MSLGGPHFSQTVVRRYLCNDGRGEGSSDGSGLLTSQCTWPCRREPAEDLIALDFQSDVLVAGPSGRHLIVWSRPANICVATCEGS